VSILLIDDVEDAGVLVKRGHALFHAGHAHIVQVQGEDEIAAAGGGQVTAKCPRYKQYS